MHRRLFAGIIGCGGFTRGVHVPNLLKNPRYKIAAAADSDIDAAAAAAGETGAAYHTDDINRVLEDEKINAVFIVTRHDSHADISVKAARAGKHIFCEKPMGLNMNECRRVAEAVAENNVLYSIGYNRGLAPMVARASELLGGSRGKILAYHRMQNILPPAHWLLDPAVGGGRITGEGCHIFDMLCEIMPAPPCRVYAQGGRFLDGSIDPRDSAEIMLTFADGSVGTALLMSAGSDAFPKESTEIYCGGRAVHIKNFSEMLYCGFEGKDTVKLSFDSPDKGHAIEIDLFADAVLEGAPAPNSLEKAMRAALIGFKAAESIDSGKPLEIRETEYRSPKCSE